MRVLRAQPHRAAQPHPSLRPPLIPCPISNPPSSFCMCLSGRSPRIRQRCMFNPSNLGNTLLTLWLLNSKRQYPSASMPPVSRSPKRKRVRRYFSASAATGIRWNPKIHAVAGTSTATKTRKRGSSVSSDETYGFSPDQAQDEVHSEEDTTFRYSTVDNSFPVHDHQPESPDGPRPPLTYASLPPTPISSSPPLQPTSPSPVPLPAFQTLDSTYQPPFSLWDYLREELLATDFDSHQELKWERVSNFLSMPIAIEKVGRICSIRVAFRALNPSLF